MAYQHLIVTYKDHRTTITFNRPEVLNAINPLMHKELEDALTSSPKQHLKNALLSKTSTTQQIMIT